jgi:septum formation protein
VAAGFEFDVDPVAVDERRLAGESPAAHVERVARLKAGAACLRHPSRVVLAADTTVVLGADVLGKPRDAHEARDMLGRLSGRSHTVLTGFVVRTADQAVCQVESTTVWMRSIEPGELIEYVATGEPLDKAGAYAIQGWAARFIPRIEGSYSNVVGLPIAAVADALSRIAPEMLGRRLG